MKILSVLLVSVVFLLTSCSNKNTPEYVSEAFIEALLVESDFKSALSLTIDEAYDQLSLMMRDQKAMGSSSQLEGVSYSVKSVKLSTEKITKDEYALVILIINATIKGVEQENEQYLKLKKEDGQWMVWLM